MERPSTEGLRAPMSLHMIPCQITTWRRFSSIEKRVVDWQHWQGCQLTTWTILSINNRQYEKKFLIDNIEKFAVWQPCQFCCSTTSYLKRVLSIDNIEKVVNQQPGKCCQSSTEHLKKGLSIDIIGNFVDWQTCQCCWSTTNINNTWYRWHYIFHSDSVTDRLSCFVWPRDVQSTTRHACILTRARCPHTVHRSFEPWT